MMLDALWAIPIILVSFSVGAALSSLLADWSMCRYPDYWHSWIEEHRKRR